jgi:hypothetical protein
VWRSQKLTPAACTGARAGSGCVLRCARRGGAGAQIMANSSHCSRWTAGGFLLASSFTPMAHAQLAPAFATKISVDTQYVTGAGGATDIAFAADGRALVTRKGGSITLRRANGSQVVIAYPFGGTLDTGSEKGLLGARSAHAWTTEAADRVAALQSLSTR